MKKQKSTKVLSVGEKVARDFHGVQGNLRINLRERERERDSDSSPHREQVKSKKSS